MIIKNRIFEIKSLNKVESLIDIDRLLTTIFNKFEITYNLIGVTYVEDMERYMYSFRIGDTDKDTFVYCLSYNIWKNEEIERFGKPYVITGISLECTKLNRYKKSELSNWNIDFKEKYKETKKEQKERKAFESMTSGGSKEFLPLSEVDVFFNYEFPNYLKEEIVKYNNKYENI